MDLNRLRYCPSPARHQDVPEYRKSHLPNSTCSGEDPQTHSTSYIHLCTNWRGLGVSSPPSRYTPAARCPALENRNPQVSFEPFHSDWALVCQSFSDLCSSHRTRATEWVSCVRSSPTAATPSSCPAAGIRWLRYGKLCLEQ